MREGGWALEYKRPLFVTASLIGRSHMVHAARLARHELWSVHAPRGSIPQPRRFAGPMAFMKRLGYTCVGPWPVMLGKKAAFDLAAA